MFDNINMNLRKNEGFLTSIIPCIPIPEYGQFNAPLVSHSNFKIVYYIQVSLESVLIIYYRAVVAHIFSHHLHKQKVGKIINNEFLTNGKYFSLCSLKQK